MKLRIVTGASENHAKPLLNLLASLDHWERGSVVVVYDLGLEESRDDVAASLGSIRRLFEKMPFERLPRDVSDIKLFSWKPWILRHEWDRMKHHEEQDALVWLDAGNLVHGRLHRLRMEVDKAGLYTPTSSGTIGEWTFPSVIADLGAEGATKTQCRTGGLIGLKHGEKQERFLDAWLAASLERRLICPDGASKANHRFDQSLLSILFYRHGYECDYRKLDVSTHNDHLSEDEAAVKYRTRMMPVAATSDQ